MTLAQIASIIALLLAFNVDPATVKDVQGILNASASPKQESVILVPITGAATLPKTMKTIEVHQDQHQNRYTFYVLVKENGKELAGVDVAFDAPSFTEPKYSTTYEIGRVVRDNPGASVEYAQTHTGARFVYEAAQTATLEFYLKDDPSVRTEVTVTVNN